MSDCIRDCKRIKRTYPHGRNAAPVKSCKDCGRVLKPMDIKKNSKFKRRPRREREEYPLLRCKVQLAKCTTEDSFSLPSSYARRFYLFLLLIFPNYFPC